MLQMDAYFDNVISRIPTLHPALIDHSDDISTRDLSKLFSYGHSALKIAVDARSELSELVEFCNEIDGFIQMVTSGSVDVKPLLVGSKARDYVIQHLSLICHIVAAIEEILDATSMLYRSSDNTMENLEEFMADIRSHLPQLVQSRTTLSEYYRLLSRGKLALLFSDGKAACDQSMKAIHQTSRLLEDWIQREAWVSNLSSATLQSVSQRVGAMPKFDGTGLNEEKDVPERPINVMLVALQQLEKLGSVPPTAAFLKDGSLCSQRLSATFNIGSLWQECQHFISVLEGSTGAEARIRRLLPFLQRFHSLATQYSHSLASWAMSLFKLSSILMSLGVDLAERGFCKPSEGQAADTGGNLDAKADGTGIGEGEGENNISNEITDESQVEGMQGQESQPKDQRGEDKNQEESVAMDKDFDGDLESVGTNNEQNDSESDEDPQSEEEDTVENLDPADPDAVNEKMWQSQGNEKDQKEDLKAPQQPKGDESKDSELAAKESESQKQLERNKNEPSHEEMEAEDQPDAPDDLEMETEGPDLDNLPNEAGAEMDRQLQEEEILDLPEGMDLNPDDSEPGSDHREEITSEDEARDAEAGSHQDAEGDEHVEADVIDNTSKDDAENDDMLGDKVEPVSKPDQSAGEMDQGLVGQTTEVSGDPDEAELETDDAKNRSEQDSDIKQSQTRDKESQKGNSEGISHSTQDTRASGETAQQEISPSQVQKSRSETLDQVQRRYEQILQKEDSDESGLRNDQSVQMEYTEDDTMDSMHMLAPATQDEVAKLRDLNIVDSEQKDAHVDEEMEIIDLRPSLPSLPRSQDEPKQGENEQDGEVGNVDHATTGDRIRAEKDVASDSSDTGAAVPTEGKMEMSSEDVEVQLLSWQKDDHQAESLDSLWRLYTSLTHELAWSLCEQLRLILEPTKATRLRGDYRTGKRLNMKKIIPYIASDYTKDKIWLRRTRPSQREYQILLALDDSRSMAESHHEHLAFQTLALVSKALTRLEAGDISLMKFGERAEVIHGFDDGPFNDAAGARALGSFKFNQNSTDVLALIETSLQVLDRARETHSGRGTDGSLWQMEIIISDGICSDHEKLGAALRRAAEQHVLVVFIIVDDLKKSSMSKDIDKHLENSIISLKHVREDLTIERYLDIFPFEYYVVLRNVDALPEVLSSTLRQFFERIAEE